MTTSTQTVRKQLHCPQFHRATPWAVFRLTDGGWVTVARFSSRTAAEREALLRQRGSGIVHKCAWEEVSFK